MPVAYWEFFWLKFFLEFLYGILSVLYRFRLHYLVENSIFYKKDIQHFYIGPILFSEIKSYGRLSAEKLTVKFYLAPGVRNRKFYLAPGMKNGKMHLAPNDSYEKFYLAVKGLTFQPRDKIVSCLFDVNIDKVSWTPLKHFHQQANWHTAWPIPKDFCQSLVVHILVCWNRCSEITDKY